MKVITFSRTFPATHPRKGIDTFFPEQILNSLGVRISDVYDQDFYSAFRGLVNDFAMLDRSAKHHTIRGGNRWKAGDWFSPRVWSGKPYASKQIQFAPDIQIKKVWNIEIEKKYNETLIYIEGKPFPHYTLLAQNDGLTVDDMCFWFNKSFTGQILCWNDSLDYTSLINA